MDAYKALDDKYLEIDFHPDSELLVLTWKSSSADIKDEEEFKRTVGRVAEIYETFKPTYVLYDQRKFFFPLTPELQNLDKREFSCYFETNRCKKNGFCSFA